MATVTATRSTRRVYSAEQLHRLRNTQSQPKLSEAIEQHESEDAELVKGMIALERHLPRCTDPSLHASHRPSGRLVGVRFRTHSYFLSIRPPPFCLHQQLQAAASEHAVPEQAVPDP